MNPYENPVKLRVSFDAPESITMVLQGPTLQAFYDWQAGEIDEDAFTEAVYGQCEDHVANWTQIREWNYAE
jgi:hypothetical protein